MFSFFKHKNINGMLSAERPMFPDSPGLSQQQRLLNYQTNSSRRGGLCVKERGISRRFMLEIQFANKRTAK